MEKTAAQKLRDMADSLRKQAEEIKRKTQGSDD